MADEGMTPYEMGEALYHLYKYGNIPEAQAQPRRRTEVRRIIRRTPNGSVEAVEHEITEEY